MFDVIEKIWESLSKDIQSYIISISANFTTDVLKKINNGNSSTVSKQLEKAFKCGLVGFVSTIYDKNVDIDHIKKLLGNKNIKKLLLDSVYSDSYFSINNLENAIIVAGVDTVTIDGFSFSLALSGFMKSFTEEAEINVELQQYIQMQHIKKISKLLENIVCKLTDPEVDISRIREIYFNYIKEKHSPMSFRGFSEKMLPLSLDQIYIKHIITTSLPSSSVKYLHLKESIEKQRELFVNEEEDNPAELSDILGSDYAVITGDPGSGKTTLLKYISLALVEGKGSERLGLDRLLLPVLVPVAAYAEGCKKNDYLRYSVDDFLSDYFSCVDNKFIAHLFKYEKQRNSVLFLFDGLDEVSNEEERVKIVARIRDFIINHENTENKFLITCRTASYTRASRFDPIGKKEFTHYKVRPFDMENIKAFLIQWYRCYEREINKRSKMVEEEAKNKFDAMVRVICSDNNIFSIAVNPLMLTILVLVEHEGGQLPRNRAELYAKCLRLLSEVWNKLRSIHEGANGEHRLGERRITEDFVVAYLGPIAFEMHSISSPVIDYSDLKDNLVKSFDRRNKYISHSREEADDFISIMNERAGILHEVAPSVYGFIHLTFKEYLSARYLADIVDDIFESLGYRLFLPEWKEVILLTAASLKKRDATKFVNTIFRKNGIKFENIILAAECLLDAGRDKINDDIYDEIVIALKDVMFSTAAILDRFAAAESLGRLGDPRNLKEFIAIPGGNYPLSSYMKYVDTFEIGKYPVTNMWFGEFVKDGGYNKSEYWSSLGRKWLETSRVTEPSSWNNLTWNCPNSPIVNVCWYEAEAFANWLTKTMNDGFLYRLPTDDEWGAAATGFVGRKYPWGNKIPNNTFCNIVESEIGRTSPVGLFPDGNTPDGVVDLGGNVWEWMMNAYNTFRPDKSLRGGSWLTVPDAARSSYRIWWEPEIRHDFIGFRCIRVSRIGKKKQLI